MLLSSDDFEVLLVLAAFHNCVEICELVIQRAESPHDTINATTWLKCQEKSPLMEAAVRGNKEAVLVLLKHGADVNRHTCGHTAAGHLVLALKRNNYDRDRRLEVLSLLLGYGADINAPFHDPVTKQLRVGPTPVSVLQKEMSRATLLDEVLLNSDEDVATLFRKFLPIKIED